MKTLNEFLNDNYKDEYLAMSEWSSELYSKFFQPYFGLLRTLQANTEVSDTSIYYSKLSDDDLERILIDLPIELFQSSERINSLRLELEMIRMKVKQIRNETFDKIQHDIAADCDMSGTRITKSELVHNAQSKTDDAMLEHDLLIRVYESVIARAESERGACKELIMGAKKLWDSRRSAEKSMPVSEMASSDSLPEYDPRKVSRSSYIK